MKPLVSSCHYWQIHSPDVKLSTIAKTWHHSSIQLGYWQINYPGQRAANSQGMCMFLHVNIPINSQCFTDYVVAVTLNYLDMLLFHYFEHHILVSVRTPLSFIVFMVSMCIYLNGNWVEYISQGTEWFIHT